MRLELSVWLVVGIAAGYWGYSHYKSTGKLI